MSDPWDRSFRELLSESLELVRDCDPPVPSQRQNWSEIQKESFEVIDKSEPRAPNEKILFATDTCFFEFPAVWLFEGK